MQYEAVVKGKFLSRPNRFIAYVEVDGHRETVHVKNTGRCRELLEPGNTVYLSVSPSPTRKTKYDLIAVEKMRQGKPPLLVNMDSQAPNAMVAEWLAGNLFSTQAKIRREVTYGDSRFDFYVEDGEKKAFLEVKGVTLEEDGIARFPDAPTERGVKHVKELIACLSEGYETYVFFVIQMKEITSFRPNDETHKAFGDALREANKAGVKILACDSRVTPSTADICAPVPVKL